MPGRWDGDNRGRGVDTAAQLLPGVGELVAAFSEPHWVAEEPEFHLLPHVEEWCRRNKRLEIRSAYVDSQGGYAIDLEWRGASMSVGEVRAAVFALIGSFAESATYVRQRRVPRDGAQGSLQFEVGTGELAPDAAFDPHGHVVMISVGGADESGGS